VAIGVTVAAVVAAVTGLLSSQLTYNTTPSMPRGLYRLLPRRAPSRGAIVAFPVPATLAPLVAARRYLPAAFHLLKRLVAVPGDHVCLSADRYKVNGRDVSVVGRRDALGRRLPPAFPFCGEVPPGVGFVATAAPSSLDSRYFGPIPLSQLTAAEPLWITSQR